MVNTSSERAWSDVQRWVRAYGWITAAAALYGIALAHVPFLIGHPWTTCSTGTSSLACKLLFHAYDVPLVGLNFVFAWYSLKRFSRKDPRAYMSFLSAMIAGNFAFATLEAGVVLSMLWRSAALSEVIWLSTAVPVLLGGSLLGIFINLKVSAAAALDAAKEGLQRPQPVYAGR